MTTEPRVSETALLTSPYPRASAERAGFLSALEALRPTWIATLRRARAHLEGRLHGAGFHCLQGEERLQLLSDRPPRPLECSEILLRARLKQPRRILAKMDRFEETLGEMLDVWGFRVVVADEESLDPVVEVVQGTWARPRKEDLLLRGGTLPFPALRDFRGRSWAGRSSATSDSYDQAVHLTRRGVWGIVEVQILTLDLHVRAFARRCEDESHRRYHRRRRGTEGC